MVKAAVAGNNTQNVGIKGHPVARRGRPPKLHPKPLNGAVSIHEFLVKRGPGRPSKEALEAAAAKAAAAGVTLLDTSPLSKSKAKLKGALPAKKGRPKLSTTSAGAAAKPSGPKRNGSLSGTSTHVKSGTPQKKRKLSAVHSDSEDDSDDDSSDSDDSSDDSDSDDGDRVSSSLPSLPTHVFEFKPPEPLPQPPTKAIDFSVTIASKRPPPPPQCTPAVLTPASSTPADTPVTSGNSSPVKDMSKDLPIGHSATGNNRSRLIVPLKSPAPSSSRKCNSEPPSQPVKRSRHDVKPERTPERVSIRRQLLASEREQLTSTTVTVAASVDRARLLSSDSTRSRHHSLDSSRRGSAATSPGASNALDLLEGDWYDQVFSTEPISAMTVPDSVQLENAHAISERWKSEWNRPLQLLSKNITAVKHPEFVILEPAQTTQWSTFDRPKGLIETSSSSELQCDAQVLYSLDHDDMNWLERYNIRCPRNPLGASDMERIMDRLEKDSHATLNASKLTLVPEERPTIRTSPQIFHRYGSIYTALSEYAKLGYDQAPGTSAADGDTSQDVFWASSRDATRPNPHSQPKVPPMVPPPQTYMYAYRPIPGADPGKRLTIEGFPVNMTSEEQLRASVSSSGIADRLGVGRIQSLATMNYWVHKRSLRNWRSLLREYHHPSPREWLVSKSPTYKHKLKVARNLRTKFEKLRLLTDLCRKRAELQAQILCNREQAFMAQLEIAAAAEQVPVESRPHASTYANLDTATMKLAIKVEPDTDKDTTTHA